MPQDCRLWVLLVLRAYVCNLFKAGFSFAILFSSTYPKKLGWECISGPHVPRTLLCYTYVYTRHYLYDVLVHTYVPILCVYFFLAPKILPSTRNRWCSFFTSIQVQGISRERERELTRLDTWLFGYMPGCSAAIIRRRWLAGCMAGPCMQPARLPDSIGIGSSFSDHECKSGLQDGEGEILNSGETY